jgi:dTDP-D-glucose 4,6-dehydratase
MKPTNNKSLLHFIFDQMEKLDEKKITVDEAKAQANLAKQANNSLKYEIDRAKIMMELQKHNETELNVTLRNAEGINFE